MRYFGKQTYFTQGATQEQLVLEKELHKLKKELNKENTIALVLIFSVIGIPIAIIYVILGLKKSINRSKRIKQLQMQIEEIEFKNAPIK